MDRKGKTKIDSRTIIILLVIGAVIFFVSKGFGPEVPDNVDNKGVVLKACVSDSAGNCLTPTELAAIVTIGGDAAQVGAKYIAIESTVTNVPAVGAEIQTEITNVQLSGTPTIFGDEVALFTQGFSLAPSESNVQNTAGIDITDPALLGLNTFQLDVSGSYFDAQGNSQAVSTFGTVNVLIEKDTCEDSTPWGGM